MNNELRPKTLADLLEHWPAGKDAVAAHVWERFHRHALRAGIPHQAAEELAQDQTVKVLQWLDRNGPTLQGTGAGFLRVSADRAVASWFRARERDIAPTGPDPDVAIAAALAPEPPADEALDRRRNEDVVRAALGDLGEADRRLIQQVELEGRPLQELVDEERAETRAPPDQASTVRNRLDKRLQRAREKLRRAIESRGGAP